MTNESTSDFASRFESHALSHEGTSSRQQSAISENYGKTVFLSADN